MWMIRSNGGDYTEDFIKEGIVAIGWKGLGSLKRLNTRGEIIQHVAETYPEYKKLQAVVAGSQIDKFVNVMKVGDPVLTYDPSSRVYHVGKIVGEYAFDENADDELVNQRPVRWEHVVFRDLLSLPAKNSLGATLTIFVVSEEAEQEIKNLSQGLSPQPEEPELTNADIEDEHYLFADVKARAKEFVKDRVVDLDWKQMQELVAGILRAMGYKTQISPEGSDRGKDIVASPDGFGFEHPRIIVEVKHRPKQQMASGDIRSFLGGRHKDDRGLYVSTGGFSKDAKYEAERAAIPLSLLDIDGLVDVLIDQYDELDLATRTLVPLARIYWPS